MAVAGDIAFFVVVAWVTALASMALRPRMAVAAA